MPGLYRSRDGALVAAMRLKKAVLLDYFDGGIPITGAAGSWMVMGDGRIWFERDVSFVEEYSRIAAAA